MADNDGFHSAETSKVYQGGTIENILTGTVDFSANIQWSDGANEASRLANTNPGSVVLWRYANESGNDTDDDKEGAAQAATGYLVQTDSDGNVVLGADGKPIYLTQIDFTSLDKYDRSGNLYIYYLKEKLNGELGSYQAIYSNTDYALNGGSITNSLAGTRNFVVEAEWKAAARQGGTASVTYMVQQKVNGVWQDVSTPMIDAQGNYLKEKKDEHGNPVYEGGKPVYEITEDVNEAAKIPGLVIDNFKAETMKQIGRFGSLPMYDTYGNVIEYRVVQKEITRIDGSETDHYTELTYQSTPDNSPIIINGDKYNIEVNHNTDSDSYKFTYQLTGNMPMVIKKYWDDSTFKANHPGEALPSHDNDTINAWVKQYDFERNEYVTYPTDPTDEDFIAYNSQYYDPTNQRFQIDHDDHESASADGTTRTWSIELQVPIYDENGHEYQYDVTETNKDSLNAGPDGSYIMRVSYTPMDPNNPGSKNTYTISNSYAEGPGYDIAVSKEWKDDGDLLHRTPIDINYTADVSGSNGSTVLNNQNVWLTYIGKYENYVYNSDNFTESRNDGTSSNYWKIATFQNDYTQTVEFTGLDAGTYRVFQKNGANWEPIGSEQSISQGGTVTANLTKKTNLLLKKADTSADDGWREVHLTASAIHSTSYAGNSAPTFETNNNDNTVSISYSGNSTYLKKNSTSSPTGYEWIDYLQNYYDSNSIKDLKNEKIIKFDKLVAVYQDNNHYYAVEQDGSDGSVKFINTRIGVVSYEIDLDLCLGGWEDTATAAEKKFKVRIKGKVNGTTLKYPNGQEVVIEEEIDIQNGLQKYYLTNLPKYDGEGKIIDWQIEEIQIAGQTVTQANGVRSCTIDGKTCVVTATDPAYNYGQTSHSDDLISVTLTNRFTGSTNVIVNKMWYDDNNDRGLRGNTTIQLWRKSNDPDDTVGWKQLGGDYDWTPTEQTVWHYVFEGLEEYDKKGYPYYYAIWERPIPDYTTTTYDTFIPSTGLGTPTSDQSLPDRMVPNNGWFVDRLYGEIVFEGKKLWNNISTVLDNSHYPIANIVLKRKNTYKIIPSNVFTVEADTFTQDTNDPEKYVATTTISGLAAGTYKAVNVTSGLTVSPDSEQTVSKNGSITVTLTVTGQPTAAQSFKLQLYENNTWKDSFKVLTTDEDAFKIGQTSIYSGDKSYYFKKDIQWYDDPNDTSTGLNNHEIKDGYYILEGDEPKTKLTGSAHSIYLPKFDEFGAAITYIPEEVVIQGYVFEIDNENITNDYTGGRPVEIAVTKKWENMDNTEYPSVKLILHQIMFAKTTDGDHYRLDENDQPVITPVEYATYEKVLKKGETGCTGDEWTYTFGELNDNGTRKNPKENIRQFAPDGTCFQYFITEELINNDGERITLNALDKDVASQSGNPQNATRTADGYLGDFFKANEIYDAIVSATSSTLSKYHVDDDPYIAVNDDGLGFKVKEFTQPAVITDTGPDACSDQNVDEKISRSASIKNSYEPDFQNFEGQLIVTKDWNHHDTGQNENPLNTENFEAVKDYTFTVSRLTKNISEKELFKIETFNTAVDMPVVTPLDNYFHFTEDKAMAKYDSTGAPIDPDDNTTPVAYYQEILKLNKNSYSHIMDNIYISFKIYKTAEEYNKVDIEGLAIYAQDAIRYTYKLTEDFTNLIAYKNSNDSEHPLSGKMEDVEENGETVTKKEFELFNELKVFNLKLNKVFGKEYTPEGQSETTIKELAQADYHQYFNENFVTQNENVQFQLWRKTVDQNDEDYQVYEYGGNEWQTVTGSGRTNERVYSKTFYTLPRYSPDGKLYQYKVVEKDAPAGAHY